MRYLVDTNVISELRKGERCDTAVAQWWATIQETDIFLSVLTIGEIRRGIENIRRRDAASADVLNAWLGVLVERHADRIIHVDMEVATEWGRLSARDPLPVIDGLLAATAKVHHFTFVTRNTADVVRTGVVSLNPWLR